MTTRADDRVLAEIGQRRIVYAELACSREKMAARPRLLHGKTAEEFCVEWEREEFRRLATMQLVDEIGAIEKCEPSPAEIEPFRSRLMNDDATLQRGLAESRKIPEAIRRVYLGESVEIVYDEVIKPMNRGTIDDFRRQVAAFRSLEVVERFLATDWSAKLKRDMEESARRQAVRAALRKRIETIAAEQRKPYGAVADAYLRAMLTKIPVRIYDEQFELPSGYEVFR